MNKWQIIGLLLCVSIYVVSKLDTTISATPEGQQVVSGILAELADADLEMGWQYDQVRREALALARSAEERGSFKAPEWMSERLSSLSVSSSAKDVKAAYREVSERLYEAQAGEVFDRGRDYVRSVMDNDDSDTGKCRDCDGTGKVGDGVIFTECLACGGDGVVDESDRKEVVEFDETSTQERSGDQVSRNPDSVSSGSAKHGTVRRMSFPLIRRLIGR